MRPRYILLTALATLTLLLSSVTTTLAAPTGPKHLQEVCLQGMTLQGERVDGVYCLLYQLPEGTKKAELKRLEVVGTSVGSEGVLLDQPQTVDATDRNAVVRGQGRSKDSQLKEVDVNPAMVMAYCSGADIIFYEGIYNSGDSVCVYPNTYPYVLLDMSSLISFSHPFGWDNIMSAYESPTANRNIALYQDYGAPYGGNAMIIPFNYAYALDWVGSFWSDTISSFRID